MKSSPSTPDWKMEDASVEKATNQAEVKRGGTVSVVGGGGLPLAAALIISPSNPYFIPFPSVFTLFCHDKGFHSTYEKLQKCQHIPQKTNKTSDQLCVCLRESHPPDAGLLC